MFFAEPPGGVPKAQTQATSCGTVKLARDHWDPAYAPGTPIVAKEGRNYVLRIDKALFMKQIGNFQDTPQLSPHFLPLLRAFY